MGHSYWQGDGEWLLLYPPRRGDATKKATFAGVESGVRGFREPSRVVRENARCCRRRASPGNLCTQPSAPISPFAIGAVSLAAGAGHGASAVPAAGSASISPFAIGARCLSFDISTAPFAGDIAAGGAPFSPFAVGAGCRAAAGSAPISPFTIGAGCRSFGIGTATFAGECAARGMPFSPFADGSSRAIARHGRILGAEPGCGTGRCDRCFQYATPEGFFLADLRTK